MKKRVVLLAVFAAFAALVSICLISADLLKVSSTHASNEVWHSDTYNFTVNNTNNPAGINFTQLNVTFPSGYTIKALTNGTTAIGGMTVSGQTLSWENDSGLVKNGTIKYFWVDVITANQTGNYNIIVKSLDYLGNANTTDITVTLSDTTRPKVNFVSPTPSSGTTLNQNFIPVNITAIDPNMNNITILFINLTGNSPTAVNNKSSRFFYNFTNLSNGKYNFSATAWDSSGNGNTTSLRTITINVTSVSCAENWTCGNWTSCSGSTLTQTRTCTDQNSCGTNSSKPSTSQSCTVNPSCENNWVCGKYLPENCTPGQLQIQICTDSNNCTKSSENNTRTCPIAAESSSAASSQSNTNNASKSFLLIIGLIIAGIVTVAIVLIKLKNKPHNSIDDFGPGRNDNLGNNTPYNGPGPGYPPQGSPRRYY